MLGSVNQTILSSGAEAVMQEPKGFASQFSCLVSDLQIRILKAKRGRYSREDVAVASGVHLNTIARLLSGGNLSIETLIQISKGVDALEARKI